MSLFTSALQWRPADSQVRSLRSICPYCLSKENDRYLRLKSSPSPLPHSEPIHTNIHGAKPWQKLINDISLHVRETPTLSAWVPLERRPGFIHESERERIQSEPWNTMVDTVNPGCRFDFIAALTPGNVVPPVESVRVCPEFLGAFMTFLIWLHYRLILLHFISRKVNKRVTCHCESFSDLCPSFTLCQRHCQLYFIFLRNCFLFGKTELRIYIIFFLIF